MYDLVLKLEMFGFFYLNCMGHTKSLTLLNAPDISDTLIIIAVYYKNCMNPQVKNISQQRADKRK